MARQRSLGELVTFPSKNGLSLDGILCTERGNGTTVVHVHGSLGNFYQNKFVRVMARKYVDAGVNFLSFNQDIEENRSSMLEDPLSSLKNACMT